LPACIPIARSLEENSTALVRYGTVAGLLLAVAVIQLYGQERNNRDRIKTEDRINEQQSLLGEQKTLLTAIAFAIAEQSDQFRAQYREQSTQLRRIADGIAAAAAAAEEFRQEEGD
jgi:predicted histidine transporter YuiF (NhaC family)